MPLTGDDILSALRDYRDRQSDFERCHYALTETNGEVFVEGWFNLDEVADIINEREKDGLS